MRAARAILAPVAALAMLAAGPAWAQASLTAELALLDPLTGRATEPDAGDKLRLRVSLREPATDAAPRGLLLRAWARPVAADNPGCARAAQNFRSTRRTPLGSVDMNGVLVSVLNRDASLSVIDPKLNLYSSNLIAAHVLNDMPAAIAADRRGMRMLAAHADGRIEAVDVAGPGRTVIARDLGPLRAIVAAPNGRIWAGTQDGALIAMSPAGEMLERTPLPGPVTLIRPDDPESPLLLAFTDSGAARMIDASDGRAIMATRFPAPLRSVAPVGQVGLIALQGDAEAAQIRYADAPDRAVPVALGAPFARVATDPAGRIAVLWTPGDALVALVDLALGRVVQQLSLDKATVSEVTFTDNAAYLLSHDGGYVGALDLATVALGRSAVMRQVNLGFQGPAPDGDTRLIVPLLPAPQVMAVTPENQTGWLIEELASSVEMPPMDSVRLRGGIPARVHILDRSFDEVAPGVFEAAWAFDAGDWELVLTSDLGDISTCVPFHVRGAVERAELRPVRLIPDVATAAVVGRDYDLRLRVLDTDGAPVALDRLALLVPSMISGWSTRVTASKGADGTLRATLRLPHAGPFAIQPLDLPPPYSLRSASVITAVEHEEAGR